MSLVFSISNFFYGFQFVLIITKEADAKGHPLFMAHGIESPFALRFLLSERTPGLESRPSVEVGVRRCTVAGISKFFQKEWGLSLFYIIPTDLGLWLNSGTLYSRTLSSQQFVWIPGNCVVWDRTGWRDMNVCITHEKPDQGMTWTWSQIQTRILTHPSL